MPPLWDETPRYEGSREPPAPCPWCGEDVTGWDRALLADSGRPVAMHAECLVRSLAGSVGHQMGWCDCPGGTGAMYDPPGVSRREAARLAAAVKRARHSGEPHIVCPACGRTSFHPQDIVRGYCGHCHEFTGKGAQPCE